MKTFGAQLISVKNNSKNGQRHLFWIGNKTEYRSIVLTFTPRASKQAEKKGANAHCVIAYYRFRSFIVTCDHKSYTSFTTRESSVQARIKV
jgi:hypothetical protein